ncbi:MAG: endonuclease MutS2 [Bacillota bacterium]|jgi:DNA mismatch repair protein MutS2
MNEKVLKRLEYDKIITKVAGYTSFSYGKELVQRLLPITDEDEVAKRQSETGEAKAVLRLFPTFSLGSVRDIREHLQHLSIGGILDPEGLVAIADTCRAARLTKNFFSELRGSYPVIGALGKHLTVIKTIETAVEKAIGPDNSINDGASERLHAIRKKIKTSNDRIKERLDSLIKSPHTQKFLQEPIITLRDGRYVVPVRQEYRAQVPGIVHDVSASGASVFVEPMAVMELNNELQKLAREEAEEINVILRSLSLVVGGFSDDLAANLVKQAQLDLVFAKARYSYEINGMAPKLNSQGCINLVAARHPLISPDLVVPIDISLNAKVAAMVITGPNTGGKTVTLKTIGLLTLMTLAGLHIPANHGSEVSIFKQIFADIGDEQSIEQSLSTFSSHMVNIIHILENSAERTLVLLDELGAGTDPAEGAALAMAILKYLKNKKTKVIATTHYSELKAFAYNNPGFVNASVEFDIESLSPTYRLLMGVPGKSNAFEISGRLGLAPEIIEEASDLLSKEDAQVADLLANLELMRQEALTEKSEAAQLRAQLLQKEQEMNDALEAVAIKEADIIRKANQKAQKIIADTQKRSEKHYQELCSKMEQEKLSERAFQESKRRLKDWQAELEQKQPAKVYGGKVPTKVKIGQTVYIPSLDQKGIVLELPDNENRVALQVGILKMSIKLPELRLTDQSMEEKKFPQSYSNNLRLSKAQKIKNEVDLRGLDSQEALEVLDKYLDDIFVAGLKSSKIIHGKGTGVLRAAVGEYLKKHRLVKSFKAGGYHEGGMGVTIVELDV